MHVIWVSQIDCLLHNVAEKHYLGIDMEDDGHTSGDMWGASAS